MWPTVATVSLVVTLLEGYARGWSRATSLSTFRGRLLSTILWGEFSEAFLECFILDADRAALQERFLHIHQGDRMMLDHERKFNHLVCFVGNLAATDRDRVARFYEAYEVT
ncbi:hypothetical protein KSP40_PGU003587 [Platanthera guangdongensis]|uniref:Retrotransposon gag domain-containing protein n=1 Tax=Platanthera guangdongensis TaxID=2320717 RepID=A0ABR2MVK3_9ASPA